MGSVTPHRTLWDRRYRSNVESDLHFFGDNVVKQHLLIPLDNRYDFGTGEFTFSHIIEKNNGALWDMEIFGGGSTIAIQSNPTANTVTVNLNSPDLGALFQGVYNVNIDTNAKYQIDVTRQGEDIQVSHNGSAIGTIQLGTPNVNFNFSGATRYVIGIRGSLSNNALLGTVSHVKAFNAKLLYEEIQFSHKNGGLVKSSAHESCISHYALTERTAFKVDASFAAKHPSLSVGDNVFFDQVGAYNYAKPLVNYTLGSNFDGNIGFGGDAGLLTNGLIMTFTDAFTGTKTSTRDLSLENISSTEIVFDPIDVDLSVDLYIKRNSDDFVLFSSLGISSGANKILLGSYITDVYVQIDCTKSVTGTGNKNLVWKLVNDQKSYRPNHAKAVNFTDAELGTGGDVRTQSVKKDFYEKNTNIWYQGAGDPIYQNNVEKLSGFNPLSKGLRFIGSDNHRLEQNSINIDPNADFYTFMVVHKKPNGEEYVGFDDMFFQANDGSSQNFVNLNGRDPRGGQITIRETGNSKAHIWLDTPTPPDQIQCSFFVVDQALAAAGNSSAERYISNGNEITSFGSSSLAQLRFDLYTKFIFGNNTFGGAASTFNGWLFAFAIWNRGLPIKEMIRLTNNTLLMNPDELIKQGLQQYNLFNAQTANGIEDFSGNGNHIDTFINYTANQLDPLDAQYVFQNVNSQR